MGKRNYGDRPIRSAWLGIACLLGGCAGPAVSASPASSPSAAVPTVTIVAWAVPSTLQVGQPGFLQVKLIATHAIESGTLSAASADPAVAFVPPQIPIKDLFPPRTGRNAPGRSPPEPPALGVVPMYTFQMNAARPGVYPVEVKFVYGNTVVTQHITVKGAEK